MTHYSGQNGQNDTSKYTEKWDNQLWKSPPFCHFGGVSGTPEGHPAVRASTHKGPIRVNFSIFSYHHYQTPWPPAWTMVPLPVTSDLPKGSQSVLEMTLDPANQTDIRHLHTQKWPIPVLKMAKMTPQNTQKNAITSSENHLLFAIFGGSQGPLKVTRLT